MDVDAEWEALCERIGRMGVVCLLRAGPLSEDEEHVIKKATKARAHPFWEGELKRIATKYLKSRCPRVSSVVPKSDAISHNNGAMNMAFQARQAQRKQIKLKIGVGAPSGGGKTYSSLLLARGLADDWGKVYVVDTENESAAYYDKLGSWNHVPFVPPYTPERYIEAINYCVSQGAQVVVIDSTSHEWDGKGGCLEINTQLGGKVTDWAKVTPRHRAFIDSILQSPVHVIGTVRKKTEWEIEKGDNGKVTARKVGLADVQRQGLEYEWGLSLTLAVPHHLATVEKDRTGLFMGRPEFLITQETGVELRRWAEAGHAPTTYDNASRDDKHWLMGELKTRSVDQRLWKGVSERLNGKARAEIEKVINDEWQNQQALDAAASEAAFEADKAAKEAARA